MNTARTVLLTLRLSLPKIGLAYMFVLLTSNFNRISVNEFLIWAVLITTMTGLHNFISPLQVFWGRMSDRYPVFGYHRTPYLIGGALTASLIFPILPRLLPAMATNSVPAFVAGFGLFVIYGIAIAAMGDAHHSLIADVTTERQRGTVVMVVWFFLIASSIASAIFLQIMFGPQGSKPLDFAVMQRVYNLAPVIMLVTTLLGIVGLEKRDLRPRSSAPAPGNPFRVMSRVLRTNQDARRFFGFVFLAIFAIFLQDNILELFGAEVFKLSVTQTTSFTQNWNIGALLGMLVVGLIVPFLSQFLGRRTLSKAQLVTAGGALVALGLGGIAASGITDLLNVLKPSIFLMGLGAGVFNVGALALMMDMTPNDARGTYMGVWGMAQALGTGLSSVLSGGLHTLLIEQLHLAPRVSYLLIFGGEAVVMLIAIGLLREVSVTRFLGNTSTDLRELPVLDGLAA